MKHRLFAEKDRSIAFQIF